MKKPQILGIIEEELRHLNILKEIVNEQPEQRDIKLNEIFLRHPYYKEKIQKEVNVNLKRYCPYANNKDPFTIQFLSGNGTNKRIDSKKEIKKFLKFFDKSTIVDPYFFSKGIVSTNKDYLKEIDKMFLKKNVKLDIYYTHQESNTISKKIQSIRKICEEKNIKLSIYQTDLIHDRVIIRNDKSGIVVGTSFGGLGNKFAFIIPLPDNDLHDFKVELYKIRENNGDLK